MAVTPGVEDGRVYFICSGPIGGLFVFLQSGVGRSGTIPLFIPLSVNAAHIPGVSPASPPRKLRHTCSGSSGMQSQSHMVMLDIKSHDKRALSFDRHLTRVVV